MPSITPSNSRRRHSRISTIAPPLKASSTNGATKIAVVETLPPASLIAIIEAVLITRAPKVANPAPQANASTSSDVGSASYRSSQRNVATTGNTGIAASTAPVIRPSGPVSRVIASRVSRLVPARTTTMVPQRSVVRIWGRRGAISGWSPGGPFGCRLPAG